MMWLILSLLTALLASLRAVFSKKSVKKIDPYIVAWAWRFFAFVFLIPILLFIDIPSIQKDFWTALFVSGTLNTITSILFIKALKLSDMSITIPMTSLTPLFIVIISPFIIGEIPTPIGIMGVILIVLGSYLLNIKKKSQGFFAPFKALFEDKGARLMLIVALIWSVTSIYDKIGVQNSSPYFWSISISLFITIALTPFMISRSKEKLRFAVKNIPIMLPIGLFSMLMLLTQMTAISMTLVSYVISIKRLNAVFSVILGFLIFKEKNIKERLLGTTVMVVGVILITMS